MAPPGPLKVVILAGQSNILGRVNMSTFDSMADNRICAEDHVS